MITLDMKLSETAQISYQSDPIKYLLTEELKSAVKVAITLGQPLLITGEPGTGKTQLAYKVAYDLSRDNPDFYETPFVFNTKTTSTATDLFYLYDAILRRCVFYHIPFPSKEELFKIVQSHLGEDSKYAKDDELIIHFQKIREILTKKKPATAELIAWLRILELENFLIDGKVDLDNLTSGQKSILMISYSVLAKTREDLETLREDV